MDQMDQTDTAFSRKNRLGRKTTSRPDVVESVVEKFLEVTSQAGFVCLVEEVRPSRTCHSFYCVHVSGAQSTFDPPLGAQEVREAIIRLSEEASYPVRRHPRQRDRRRRGVKICPILNPRRPGIRFIPTWV